MENWLKYIEWLKNNGKINYQEIAIDVMVLTGITVSVIYIWNILNQ